MLNRSSHATPGLQFCSLDSTINTLCLFCEMQGPYDRMHGVRVAFGNGLRRDIWEEFQRRFNIPFIVEAYGSTETEAGLFNMSNKIGAIGRLSPILVRPAREKFPSLEPDFPTHTSDSQTSGIASIHSIPLLVSSKLWRQCT